MDGKLISRRVTRHFRVGAVVVGVVGVALVGVVVGALASFTHRKPKCSSAVSGGEAMRALGR
jgi:hypothetical protein